MESHEPNFSTPLPGLPEGVEAVAYRNPAAGEFILAGSTIYKQPKSSSTCLVVAPANGWHFVRPYADSSEAIAVKTLPKPIETMLMFRFNSEAEAEVLEEIKKFPGYVAEFAVIHGQG